MRDGLWSVALVALAAVSCRGELATFTPEAIGPAVVLSVEPRTVSAQGLEEVTLLGRHLDDVGAVFFGDDEATILDRHDDELRVLAPRTRAGLPDIVLELDGSERVRIPGLLEVLPLELGYEPTPVAPYTVPEGATATAATAADLDGDGDPDVAIAGDTGAAAALLLNDGGVFISILPAEPDRLVAPEAVRGIVTADFDGNGSLDLLFTTGPDHPARLLLNDGTARFTPGPDLGPELASAARAVAADFDGDGMVDLALADSADGPPAVHVLLNRTAPRGGTIALVPVDPATLAGAGSIAADLVAADLDADGDVDLALLHAQPDHADGRPYTVLRNDGAGAFTVDGAPIAALVDAPGARRGVALDFHDDHDLDLYLAGNGQDCLLDNTFGQLVDATATTLPVDDARVGDVATADLDLDGFPEVVIANDEAQNRLYTSARDGRMRDATPRLPIARDETVAVLVLDVDDDGADDLFFLQRRGPATLLRWSGGAP